MNPLDPHNILPAHSDEVRRDHERNTAQPWSLLVACGMVGSVFFWGMVAVVVSGYFVPEEKGFRQKIPTCPIWPSSTLPEEPEKVICFRPPPPPRERSFFIPRPAKIETICFKHDESVRKKTSKLTECPHCDIYKMLPPVPDVELPPIEEVDYHMHCWHNSEKEMDALIEAAGLEPYVSGCFFIDEEPRLINLSEVKAHIRYPSTFIEGSVVIRIQVSPLGEYQQHEVVFEAHPLLAKAISPHLANLKFTPAIQGGKPVSCWVNVPFQFELKN